MTRSEACHGPRCGFPDDSGIAEEDRAGGGPGPASRRTGRGSGPTTSIWRAGGALTDRMTAETLRVRVDIVCVTYTCIYISFRPRRSGIDSD
jgi:hypothetical protein